MPAASAARPPGTPGAERHGMTLGLLAVRAEAGHGEPVPLLVTGDNGHAARSVAAEPGIPAADVLAQADLGMAVGAGADAAIGAAGLTLTSGDPLSIVTAIELARTTVGVIRANLAWASGYNLVAIPLAALGYLNPLFAGVAMSASSLIVVGNSLRLRRFCAGRNRA